MRIVFRLVLIFLALVLAAALLLYQVYFKVSDYQHSGPLPALPSESLAEQANWLTLFDGESLAGWTPKFVGHEAGTNYLNTFRVEGGAISVSYDNYDSWNGEFGHLFYQTPFESYLLQLEYRFLGEQIAEGSAMAWAWRNSGIMIHSEAASSMGLAQDFPVSLEAQLLGAPAGERRTTGNLCTPGTHVEIHNEVHTQHCINALVDGIVGDDWVKVELEVRGNAVIRHFVNGELAIEYHRPQLDTWGGEGKRLFDAGADKVVSSGYIALQSESHPVQFRNIRLLPLK